MTTKIRDQERPSCDRRTTAECACLHLTRLPLDRHGSFGELEGGAGENARPETARSWSEVARMTRGWADARGGWRGRCPPPPARTAEAAVECAARAAAHARKGGRGAPRRRRACSCERGTPHVGRGCARRWTHPLRGHVSRSGVVIPWGEGIVVRLPGRAGLAQGRRGRRSCGPRTTRPVSRSSRPESKRLEDVVGRRQLDRENLAHPGASTKEGLV